MDKLVEDDFTYIEVKSCKAEINRMMETIKENCPTNFMVEKIDISFFSALAKRILLFKYFCRCTNNSKYYKILISDMYYMIIAIINCDTRYVYLNERSIIENYMRMIVGINVSDDYITGNSFEVLKSEMEKVFGNDKTQYSLIKSEYSVACNYIHGGDLLQKELKQYFKECIESKSVMIDRSKFYGRILKIIKIFEKILINKYPEFVSNSFHRRKTVLEYLIGKDGLKYLFEQL